MSRIYKFFSVFALISLACGATAPAPDPEVPAAIKMWPALPTSTAIPAITPAPTIALFETYQIVSAVYKRETPGGLTVGVFSAGTRLLARCSVDGWCATVTNPPAFFWQGCTDQPADFGCEAR